MKAGAISLFITLLVAIAPLVVGAKNVPLRYTRRLPRIDKVELQKVQSAELGVRSVEEVKVVEGTQAEAIAALWRSQNFRSLSPECHQPAYAIKFYARGKLLLYASLCWDCDNIDFIEPTLNASQGFNGSSRKGQALLALLRRSFPQLNNPPNKALQLTAR
jgi:hypothetical protein